MVTRILNSQFTQYTLSALIILGTLVCVFTPNYFLFKMGSSFAVQIMLGYLGLGLSFLLLGQTRLMFTSFACCAGLCMFLKYSSNAEFKFPVATNSETIEVAHFNVASGTDGYELMVDRILAADADLVSIQEVTPDWDPILKKALTKKYPYSYTEVRLDPYGLAVYSKYRLITTDTFCYSGIPNIVGSIQPYGFDEAVHFICSHTTAPLYSGAYTKMKEHLARIQEYATSIHSPLITIGQYNAPPWWTEIQELKEKGGLHDSRRSSMSGFSNVFENPVDYIFFSEHFNCVGFEHILGNTTGHMGIQGTYEYKPDYFHAQTSLK